MIAGFDIDESYYYYSARYLALSHAHHALLPHNHYEQLKLFLP